MRRGLQGVALEPRGMLANRGEAHECDEQPYSTSVQATRGATGPSLVQQRGLRQVISLHPAYRSILRRGHYAAPRRCSSISGAPSGVHRSKTFKEDRIQTTDPYFARGMATMTIDMPGTGDAPLPGSEDAERMWDAVFDWIATRPDLDADRIGLWGGSTGG